MAGSWLLGECAAVGEVDGGGAADVNEGEVVGFGEFEATLCCVFGDGVAEADVEEIVADGVFGGCVIIVFIVERLFARDLPC